MTALTMPMTTFNVIKQGDKQMKYKFSSQSQSDIDFLAILNDLSKSNPLALVEGEGKDWFGYVCVHHTLLSKAKQLGIDPLYDQHIQVYYDAGAVVKIEHQKEFGLWIKVAKKIKSMCWKTPNRSVVTVSIPQV